MVGLILGQSDILSRMVCNRKRGAITLAFVASSVASALAASAAVPVESSVDAYGFDPMSLISPEHCPALPAPSGTVVTVGSVAALELAVSEIESGTTILIEDGDYTLGRTIHLYGGLRDIAIRGASGDPTAVVLRGAGMENPDFGSVPHGVLISDVTGVVIADLTIRDVWYHTVQVQGEQGARDVTLYNLHLIDSGEQFVKVSSGGPPGPYADDGLVACSRIAYSDRARDDYTNGVDVLAGSNWTVRDTLFERIRAPSGQLAGPAVLMWRNTIDSVIERNVFIDCDRGIALGLSDPDPARARDGETVYDHQGGIVRNNFVWRAPRSRTGDIGISVNFARDFTVVHNTVVLNGTFPLGAIEYRFAVTDGEIANNLSDAPIWQRDGAGAFVSGNIIDAEPILFEDALAGDLHLRASALSAIDRVMPRVDVTDDVDGEVRPAGDAADVGADEFVGSGVTPTAPVTPAPTSHSPTVTVSPSPTSPSPTPSSEPSPTPATPGASPTSVNPLPVLIFLPSVVRQSR